MSTVGDLKRILGELNASCESDISAIVSRSGIPIAWDLPEDVIVEHFATLAATLLGASEVVYTSLRKASPGRVVVQSDNGTLVAVAIGTNALLVAMADMEEGRLLEAVDDAADQVVEVLRKRRE